MAEVIGIGIAVGIAYWVYKDANERGSSHATLWAIGVALFLIVILPLYLICRPKKRTNISEPSFPAKNSSDEMTLLSTEYIYCPGCGRHHDSRQRFCGHCGYDFSRK